MKTIKLAWKIFKFFTLVLPVINIVLDIVATRLEQREVLALEDVTHEKI